LREGRRRCEGDGGKGGSQNFHGREYTPSGDPGKHRLLARAARKVSTL
jgi:hypothetical protein